MGPNLKFSISKISKLSKISKISKVPFYLTNGRGRRSNELSKFTQLVAEIINSAVNRC